jgi:hypothetical protein
MSEKKRKDRRYCFGDCVYLSITEHEQDKKFKGNRKPVEPHICKLFNKQVFHQGYHPFILRLSECKITEKEGVLNI